MAENGDPPGKHPEGENEKLVTGDSSEESGEVQEAFATLLKGAGIDSSKQSLEIFSANISFRGPLPHPAILKGYKEIIPDLPNRIVENWEREGSHRRETETKVVNSHNRRAHTGQWMSFIIALLGLGAAAYALLHGHQWAAAVIGSAALGVPPIVSLIRSRQDR